MRVLLSRVRWGLGDWLLFTSLIKHVNRQRPDVEVCVDTTRLPIFYLQFLCYFDIRVIPVSNPNLAGYDAYIPHLVYAPPETFNAHLLTGMTDRFNLLTGLSIKIEEPLKTESLAKYTAELPACYYYGRPVLVDFDNIHHDKRDWDMELARMLVQELLNRGVPVVQNRYPLGARPLAPGVMFRDGSTVGALLSVMMQTRAVVTLENGVSHLAGHHGVRCYTIYRPGAPSQPQHAYYPNQTALTGDINPISLARAISELPDNEMATEGSKPMEDSI